MKKVLFIILSFVLASSILLSACSSSSGKGTEQKASTPVSPSPQASGSAVSQSAGYTLPIVKEPLTIRFATQDNFDAASSYTQNLPVWQEIEKRTNIKIKWEVSTGTDFKTTMQTKLAAGSDLPDFIMVPNDPVEYAKNGLLIPIGDLIDKFAPNIKKLFQDRPDVKKYATAPDGKIYGIPHYVNDPKSYVINFPGYGIRKDWLKKLNLDEPETIDDWYNVLKAFKEKDPNGNGQADEVPLMTSYKRMFRFSGAYGLHIDIDFWDGWWAGKDGKVVNDWTNPKLKDFLTEMNKWYKAGLTDSDIKVLAGDKYTANAIGNKSGAVLEYTMMFPQWNPQLKKTAPDGLWQGIVPPKGPNGDRLLIQSASISTDFFAITKNAKNPEAIIKWLDYIYASNDGKLLHNFGIEGKSYTMVGGKPQYTDEILKNPKGSGIALWALGVGGNVPFIQLKEQLEQRFSPFQDEINQGAKSEPYFVPQFPNILPTKEESEKYSRIMADIRTYIEEMSLKFITGQEPLSNFDKFVSTLKSMGIDDATAVKQAQYNRYLKN